MSKTTDRFDLIVVDLVEPLAAGAIAPWTRGDKRLIAEMLDETGYLTVPGTSFRGPAVWISGVGDGHMVPLLVG